MDSDDDDVPLVRRKAAVQELKDGSSAPQEAAPGKAPLAQSQPKAQPKVEQKSDSDDDGKTPTCVLGSV